MRRREHEADTDLVDAAAHLLGLEVDVRSERLQHVGAARLGRHRAVAVLGDAPPRCGANEHRGGGNVEGVRSVPARADDVHEIVRVLHGHLGRELAHHLCRGGDLADRLLLHPQPDDDGRDHDGRHLSAHDLAHQVEHLVVKNLAVLDGPRQRFLCRDAHAASRCRKFLRSACPCSVRKDSGWNCTPSTARLRWRTPMISPSSDSAVTSRHSGRVERRIESEW